MASFFMSVSLCCFLDVSFPAFLFLLEIFRPCHGVYDSAVAHANPCLESAFSLGQLYHPCASTAVGVCGFATGELARTQRRSLADALQQSGGEDGGSVVFPPVLVQMLDRLESEILADRVSEESRRWLASCGLTVEQMKNQMDPVYTPARKIHLYHCDHRGLPLALILIRALVVPILMLIFCRQIAMLSCLTAISFICVS